MLCYVPKHIGKRRGLPSASWYIQRPTHTSSAMHQPSPVPSARLGFCTRAPPLPRAKLPFSWRRARKTRPQRTPSRTNPRTPCQNHLPARACSHPASFRGMMIPPYTPAVEHPREGSVEPCQLSSTPRPLTALSRGAPLSLPLPVRRPRLPLRTRPTLRRSAPGSRTPWPLALPPKLPPTHPHQPSRPVAPPCSRASLPKPSRPTR